MKKNSSTPKIVLLQGAFDVLNYGHVKAFERAKAQGSYLIVALNTTALIRRYKGSTPVIPWYQRKYIIESCRFVDRVVRAPDFSPLELLKQYRVDVLVLSREWRKTKKREIAYIKRKGGRVFWSRRFKGISSSQIKARIIKKGGKV